MELSDERRAAIQARARTILGTLPTRKAAQLPERDTARDLLFSYCSNKGLRGHMLAVECSMAAMARRFGEDDAAYRITGLLHDFDYQQHTQPDEHPTVGCALLVELGYPNEVIEAILGHASYTGVPRTSQLAKSLFAVDELTGFMTAIAYIRPTGLDGMKFKSFKKKFKTASFAAGVNRHEVELGAEEIGIPLSELVLFLAEALQAAFPDFPNISEAVRGAQDIPSRTF